MNEREGHLSSKEKGLGGVGGKGKRKERRGCGVKSPSLSLSSVLSLSTSWQLTTQRTPLQPTAALPHKPFPPSTGPPETFVPFISTTNTYRCSRKENA